MIYVVQRNNINVEYKTIYAGSSAHQALLMASKYTSCRVTLWKNGKEFVITSESTDGETK